MTLTPSTPAGPIRSGDLRRPFTTAQLAALGADPDEARRFLNGVVDHLTGWDTADPPIADAPLAPKVFDGDWRDEGLDWPSTALTMVGRRRLQNFRQLIEAVLTTGVPGDIVETGVWRGGASILARLVLAVHGVTDRRVVLADSFQGLPEPDVQRYPADSKSLLHQHEQLAVSLEQVEANFRSYGVLDAQVEFVPGWFRDTMPDLDVDRIAVLRLDGDMYESTIEPLQHLYERVAPGGYVIIDDYYFATPCRLAVHDFFDTIGVEPTIRAIDRVGAYFQRS